MNAFLGYLSRWWERGLALSETGDHMSLHQNLLKFWLYIQEQYSHLMINSLNVRTKLLRQEKYTVNSEIFARTLFSGNMKKKKSRNGKITLSFIDIGKSCLSREFFTSLICLNAISENKILMKISESTIYKVISDRTAPNS